MIALSTDVMRALDLPETAVEIDWDLYRALPDHRTARITVATSDSNVDRYVLLYPTDAR